MTHAYTPGAGDLLPPYVNHPHDPRAIESDGEDWSAGCDELRRLIMKAESAVAANDWGKARHALSAARRLIDDMNGAIPA